MSRLLTRLSTAAAVGCAVLATAFPAAAAPGASHAPSARSSVVFGAVQYDAPGPDTRSDRSLNGEWVTVTNRGNRSVELSGWTIGNRSERLYRFGHLRLAPHASVKVHTGHGRNTSRDVYQDRNRHVWGNRDTATLRDTRGHVVDSRSWGRPAGGHHGGGHHGGGHGGHH
ncbi:lamin tail domain-containing protein [Streptomyces sp. NPDC059740]|uniref:lamin tail domain-containing protein n=1 Tax=Streptomyces sp. NPDC059740 TaxID=3346926 RepID=UPI00365C58A2